MVFGRFSLYLVLCAARTHDVNPRCCLIIFILYKKLLNIITGVSPPNDDTGLKGQRPLGLNGQRPLGLKGQSLPGLKGQRPPGLKGQRPLGLKGQRPFFI